MRRAPLLLLSCLPLFAGCQLLGSSEPAPAAAATRLHGMLSIEAGQASLQPCGEQRRLLLRAGDSGLLREVALLAQAGQPLYVDLDGRPAHTAQAAFSVEHVYRLQAEGHGCHDPDWRRLVLSASGNEPDWQLRLNRHGLVLQRPGQPPLALPYLEEQLPGGSYSFSSEANGQRLELWVAPQRCRDSMTGSISHLQAELRLDGERLRGCAALGGVRQR